MNCEFKILWVEDDLHWFKGQSRNVKSFLEKHCLSADITYKNGSPEEVIDYSGNFYDLIIMDYGLSDVKTGSDIIKDIRDNNVLTDVLFYSSQIDVAISSLSPRLDGIYYSSRKNEEFRPKLEALIKKIIKRSEDLIHLRGFVLDYSSDFEIRIRILLNDIWRKVDDDKKQYLEKKVFKLLEGIIQCGERNKRKIEKRVEDEGIPLFKSALEYDHMLSHSNRLYLLNKCIELLNDKFDPKARNEYENFKSYYENDISCYRNALGHRKTEESSILVKGQVIPIDENLHQLMRKNLLHYNKLIYDMEEIVKKL